MKTILPIIIIVVVIAGITIYSQSDARNSKQDNVVVNNDDAMIENGHDNTTEESEAMTKEDESEVMEKSGSYLEYEDTTIASLDGTIVLDFSASWCPTCRAFKKDVEASIDDIPAGLSIVRVDYDSNQSLRREYGVTRQHTFVQIDNQGNKIALWTGSPTLETMVVKIK